MDLFPNRCAGAYPCLACHPDSHRRILRETMQIVRKALHPTLPARSKKKNPAEETQLAEEAPSADNASPEPVQEKPAENPPYSDPKPVEVELDLIETPKEEPRAYMQEERKTSEEKLTAPVKEEVPEEKPGEPTFEIEHTPEEELASH